MHWLLCKKYHLQCSDKWYTHKPQSVRENDEYKILLDFNIQTDKFIEHKRSYIVCVNKLKRGCQIIDFAIPCDQNMAIKEQEIIDKYQDLRTELQKVWNFKVAVIPVVIGALGTMSKKYIIIQSRLTSRQT